MNVVKIALWFCAITVVCWMGKIWGNSSFWDATEGIANGLFGIILGVTIIQKAKMSNKEGKVCSRLIEQMTFVFPVNFNSDKPFNKIKWGGYFFCVTGVYVVIWSIMKMIGKV